ncbi:hypothetical protein C8J57DRAFT_1476970 [Mycena rebaudengoi]|nr:hypothetical protein C8J57DRAFT_1476970 [Mycena rebaudengoi]
MHFPAAVILASSLTDFVLGSPFPASDVRQVPNMSFIRQTLFVLNSLRSRLRPSDRYCSELALSTSTPRQAFTFSQFASSTQKTAAMNNLQTTTSKIYASMPSNPHAFALTNNVGAIEAKIFYTGHSLLNTLLVLNGASATFSNVFSEFSVSGASSAVVASTLWSPTSWYLSTSGCGHDLLGQLLPDLQVLVAQLFYPFGPRGQLPGLRRQRPVRWPSRADPHWLALMLHIHTRLLSSFVCCPSSNIDRNLLSHLISPLMRRRAYTARSRVPSRPLHLRQHEFCPFNGLHPEVAKPLCFLTEFYKLHTIVDL